MSPFAQFLDVLFKEGSAVLQDKPSTAARPDAAAVEILKRAFATYQLTIAGPPVEFAPDTASHAGRLLYAAAWLLLSRSETESELEQLLAQPRPPRSPAEHLGADLTLRYLPQVYRRAKAHNPSDRLTTMLAEILRQWPLSGILADLEDGPKNTVDFGGHPGLMMLYAERFIAHPRPAWLPKGELLTYLELVRHSLGKDPAKLAPGAPGEASEGAAARGEKRDE
jgi:hypothetical protein